MGLWQDLAALESKAPCRLFFRVFCLTVLFFAAYFVTLYIVSVFQNEQLQCCPQAHAFADIYRRGVHVTCFHLVGPSTRGGPLQGRDPQFPYLVEQPGLAWNLFPVWTWVCHSDCFSGFVVCHHDFMAMGIGLCVPAICHHKAGCL